jgi:ABC-2 type transport system permease protein
VRRILAVFERDLRRMLRNPLALLSAVVLPLLYLFILGNSLQGPIKGLPLGVVMLDTGESSRRVVGALQALERGPRTVRLVAAPDIPEAMEALRRGQLSGFIVIPQDFSADVTRGRTTSVGLYVDNVEAVATSSLVAAVTGAMSAVQAPLARFEVGLRQVELRPQEIYPRVDYDTSLVPAALVMAIFMGTMMMGGFSLVMDRFLGVHESYLSTPLRRLDIALGVLASGTAITLVCSFITLVAGLLATGGRVHGGPLAFVLLFFVLVLTTLGLLGMMMVVLGRAETPRVVGVLGGFLNVILFFPSGALYPLASFPRWLRAFADIDPETHAIAALKAILFRGGDLAAASQHVLFLLVFAVVMVTLATMTMKRTL